MTQKQSKLKGAFWITLFVGVTFSYFLWITWEKLTLWIGNSWVVWGITGLIVLMAILTGYFSFNKIISKFT